MIQARRIGHATLETPDLDRAIDHFTEVVGLVLAEREKDRAYLASKLGPLSVALETRHGTALHAAGLRGRPRHRFRRRRPLPRRRGHRLRAAQRYRDPGLRTMLTFKDPNGIAIDLFPEWTPLALANEARGAGVLKLGHVAHVVEDPRKLMRSFMPTCSASASPTGSRTSSCSCAASRTTTR